MEPEIQNLCLEYIQNEWHKLKPLQSRPPEQPISPPWGVWIRYYDPVSSPKIIEAECVLQKTWFLAEARLIERDPWEFARFILANQVPKNTIWGVYHKIGLAAFASYLDDPRSIYLETQWGLRFGHGCRMLIDTSGSLKIDKELWLS
jgi:hypothetical protein